MGTNRKTALRREKLMDDANEVARVRKSNKGLLFFDYQSQTVRNRRANSRMAFPVSLAGLRCRRCGLRHHGLRLCDRVGLAGEKRLIPVHLVYLAGNVSRRCDLLHRNHFRANGLARGDVRRRIPLSLTSRECQRCCLSHRIHRRTNRLLRCCVRCRMRVSPFHQEVLRNFWRVAPSD
jgi:hypothetical protein